MKIKPVDNNTMQLNLAALEMYAADCDGDEMNGGFLVVQANVEGAKILCTLDHRITNLSNNTLVL